MPSKPRFGFRLVELRRQDLAHRLAGRVNLRPPGTSRIRIVPSAATCRMLGPYSSPSQNEPSRRSSANDSVSTPFGSMPYACLPSGEYASSPEPANAGRPVISWVFVTGSV